MYIYLAHLKDFPDSRLDSLKSDLSHEEIARHCAFQRTERARQFLVGRYLLRQQLALHLGISAAEVPLIEQANNAPYLNLLSTEKPGFSISHSREWIACGIRADAKVGLDIEVIDRQRDVLALAIHSLNAQQIAELHALTPAEQSEYFYRCWTAQEAQLKLHLACQDLRHLAHPQLAIAVCSEEVFIQTPEIIEIT
jgi:4'-phosphopantetheinyl transferase